jgi:hypothetical protein
VVRIVNIGSATGAFLSSIGFDKLEQFRRRRS